MAPPRRRLRRRRYERLQPLLSRPPGSTPPHGTPDQHQTDQHSRPARGFGNRRAYRRRHRGPNWRARRADDDRAGPARVDRAAGEDDRPWAGADYRRQVDEERQRACIGGAFRHDRRLGYAGQAQHVVDDLAALAAKRAGIGDAMDDRAARRTLMANRAMVMLGRVMAGVGRFALRMMDVDAVPLETRPRAVAVRRGRLGRVGRTTQHRPPRQGRRRNDVFGTVGQQGRASAVPLGGGLIVDWS